LRYEAGSRILSGKTDTRPMGRDPKPTKTSVAVAPSIAELKAEIRGYGIRSTGPRVAVLSHVSLAEAPLSHLEVYEALQDRGYDRATIYRNLIDLAEVGLLTRSDLGDHAWRFERNRNQGKVGHPKVHPHFVCIDCGKVKCLPNSSVRVVPSFGVPMALRTKDVEVQVKGRCDACA
jgi:Fur family transcriptional regulator, ferric uptake regulator